MSLELLNQCTTTPVTNCHRIEHLLCFKQPSQSETEKNESTIKKEQKVNHSPKLSKVFVTKKNCISLFVPEQKKDQKKPDKKAVESLPLGNWQKKKTKRERQMPDERRKKQTVYFWWVLLPNVSCISSHLYFSFPHLPARLMQNYF